MKMFYKRKKKTELKRYAKLFLILMLAFGLTGLGYTIYQNFFTVQVQISNIPKPQPPIALRKSSNGTSKRVKTVSDDWNYIDGNLSLKIKKVQENSGKNLVTIFVADVMLSNIDYLHTAFANNEFGLHIVQHVSQMAKNNGALFAVNGDYYGYRNNGIIVRNGILYRNNPAREMLALFRNGSMSLVDEKTADVHKLMANGLVDSFSFGPALVRDGKIAGDFSSVFRDQWFIQNLQPRTGVGMISPNHFVFLVVDGRKDYYSRGLTLTEFAGEFIKRGCSVAYNLDGGGSSTMYFKGRVVNNPLGKNGRYERYVSDIIYVDNPLPSQNGSINGSRKAA